jgi:hypothetical protein
MSEALAGEMVVTSFKAGFGCNSPRSLAAGCDQVVLIPL